jgi:hypothetical protein
MVRVGVKVGAVGGGGLGLGDGLQWRNAGQAERKWPRVALHGMRCK